MSIISGDVLVALLALTVAGCRGHNVADSDADKPGTTTTTTTTSRTTVRPPPSAAVYLPRMPEPADPCKAGNFRSFSLKAKLHYPILLANQLASWFASTS